MSGGGGVVGWITYPLPCNTSPILGAGALMLNAWTGLLQKYLTEITISFLSVVVITSALHAEGRRFEPGRKHCFSFACLQIDNYTTSK